MGTPDPCGAFADEPACIAQSGCSWGADSSLNVSWWLKARTGKRSTGLWYPNASVNITNRLGDLIATDVTDTNAYTGWHIVTEAIVGAGAVEYNLHGISFYADGDPLLLWNSTNTTVVEVLADDVPPVVHSVTFYPGAPEGSQLFSVYINATDDVAVQSVWFILNGSIFATTFNSTSGLYEAYGIGPYAPAAYAVEGVANDTTGNEGSRTVTLYVGQGGGQPPEPPPTQDLSISVSGTCANEPSLAIVSSGGSRVSGAYVRVFYNGVIQASGSTDSQGTFGFTATAAGLHVADADKAGYNPDVTHFTTSVCAQPPACGQEGFPCAGTEDCCAGLECSGGACSAPAACRQDGAQCADSLECCSAYCNSTSGACSQPPAPQCTPNAQACNSSAQCCSGICGSGLCSCAQASGACTASSNCCSGSCVNGSCAASQTNQTNGTTPGGGTQPGGGTTPGGGAQPGGTDSQPSFACKPIDARCSGNAECCSGSCMDGFCSAEACRLVGADCRNSSECCDGACYNGACVLCKEVLAQGNVSGGMNGSGALRCTACRTASCRSSSQCCEGYCSNNRCISSMLGTVTLFGIPVDSGCGAVPELASLGICDFMFPLLIVLSLVAAAASAREKNKLVPVLVFLVPLFFSFLTLAIVGALVALLEILFFAGVRRKK
jgi:hypothetical protein